MILNPVKVAVRIEEKNAERNVTKVVEKIMIELLKRNFLWKRVWNVSGWKSGTITM
jgi:hypothetical protein